MLGSSERKISLDASEIWLQDLPVPRPSFPLSDLPTDHLRPSFDPRGNRREKGPALPTGQNSKLVWEWKPALLTPGLRSFPLRFCQICLQKRKAKGAVLRPAWFRIAEVFLVRQKARGRLEEGPSFSRGPEVSGKCDGRKYIRTE